MPFRGAVSCQTCWSSQAVLFKVLHLQGLTAGLMPSLGEHGALFTHTHSLSIWSYWQLDGFKNRISRTKKINLLWCCKTQTGTHQGPMPYSVRFPFCSFLPISSFLFKEFVHNSRRFLLVRKPASARQAPLECNYKDPNTKWKREWRYGVQG